MEYMELVPFLVPLVGRIVVDQLWVIATNKDPGNRLWVERRTVLLLNPLTVKFSEKHMNIGIN